MGQVVITVPEDIHKEYSFSSIGQIEPILQELEQIADCQQPRRKNWRELLLTISAWSEEELQEIEQTRIYIRPYRK